MEHQKCALITGGSRGIGAGIAKAMAEDGYDIAITYAHARKEAEHTAQWIREKTGRACHIFQACLENRGVAEQTVLSAIDSLGRLDVLVNNAGVTKFESLPTLCEQTIDDLYLLNYKAYLMASRTAARHMIEREIRGSIVLITSTRGTRAYPTDVVYGGLKAALIRSCEAMALDLAPYGIRVNCVAPGATRIRDDAHAMQSAAVLGEKIPLGRTGTPQDIGHAVVFLCSPHASYITGGNLRIDGGLILPGMPEREQTQTGWGAEKKMR